MGHYEEALLLYQKVLLIDEQTIGSTHPTHAVHLSNFSLVV